MILAILFAYWGYKKADETGRNKILWAIVMAVTFIGVQLIAGIIIGLVLAAGVGLWGWSENAFETYYWPLNIFGVALSVGVCSGILYLLGRSPAIAMEDSAPPPPPTFESE